MVRATKPGLVILPSSSDFASDWFKDSELESVIAVLAFVLEYLRDNYASLTQSSR